MLIHGTTTIIYRGLGGHLYEIITGIDQLILDEEGVGGVDVIVVGDTRTKIWVYHVYQNLIMVLIS